MNNDGRLKLCVLLLDAASSTGNPVFYIAKHTVRDNW